VAADAKITGTVEILFCNRDGCPENGVTASLGHHTAEPVVGRFDRGIVSAMTVVALVGRFQVSDLLWLGAWLLDVCGYAVSRINGADREHKEEQRNTAKKLFHATAPEGEL
jgi:hypothetical protein